MKKISVLLVLLLLVCSGVFAEEKTTMEKYKYGPGATAVVLVDNLRVRVYPTTDSLIICELPKGTQLAFIEQRYDGKSGDTWDYVIMPNGYVGWVCEKYIRLNC